MLDGTRGSPAALVRALARLHDLERLTLENTMCDDDTVAAFGAPHLRVVHLAGTFVTDASLVTLQSLEELEELTLGETRVETIDLSTWPRLRTLALVGLDIDDHALAAIAARTSLVELDLSYTEMRDLSPLAALPHLRELGLVAVKLAPAGEAAVRALAARGVDVLR